MLRDPLMATHPLRAVQTVLNIVYSSQATLIILQQASSLYGLICNLAHFEAGCSASLKWAGSTHDCTKNMAGSETGWTAHFETS